MVGSRPTSRRPRQPSVSGAWLQYVVRGLSDLGIPIEDICRDLGVGPAALIDPDTRVARDTATMVWEEAARRSGDHLLGLHAAERFRLGLNNVLAHLIVSTASLGEALQAVARYQTLVVASDLELERRGDVTAIAVDPVGGRLPVSRHQKEFALGAIAQIIRALADRPVPFAGVQFRHECPENAEAFQRFFGCAVKFRASENSLVMASTLLHEPCRDRSAGVARRLKAMAEEDLQGQAEPSVSQWVEVALRRRLAAGEFAETRLENVARELHMSTRSLQRRLAEGSQTYASLFDAARRGLALSMLEGGLPRETIASRLGFASMTTLSRALRRWQR